MNRQQAIEFIQALNMLQPHVAPLLFGGVVNTDVVRVVSLVANSQAVCDVKPARAESTQNS
ncbi:MAG TPA: hypothetical protein VMV19_15260 [Xanthobacteraceae bacterium]|nr:hypothetical protein [Xanthobacteraceae bacterium]